MARSTTLIWCRRAIAITVRRVIPSRKQSGVGVCTSPLIDEEHVGPGRLGDLAAPVQHQRVVETPRPPRHAWTACRSCKARRPCSRSARSAGAGGATRPCRAGRPSSGRRRTGSARPSTAIARWILVLLRRHGHLLRPAPGDRADIARPPARSPPAPAGRPRRSRPRCQGILKPRMSRRLDQPLGVLAQLEDVAGVASLAFEHAAGIVQPMR